MVFGRCRKKNENKIVQLPIHLCWGKSSVIGSSSGDHVSFTAWNPGKKELEEFQLFHMTQGLPCYFLLSNLPPKRKIWSSVAFVQRWLFAPKSCSLFRGQCQLSQPLLQSSRTVHSMQQKEHSLTLFFSLGKQRDQDTRYVPSLHRYICLHKSGHSGPNPRGLACNVNRKCLTAWSISLGCSPPPPTTTTTDLMGIEGSQRWGRSLAWCQRPFSPEKFRNSPALPCLALIFWYQVAEEEGIGGERRGKASQTWHWWPGDREELGQRFEEEICQKPGRNDAQHRPLPVWQASPHKGAGDNPLWNYFPRQIYL